MTGQNGWQPMDTAPKDGTRVLLRYNHIGSFIAEIGLCSDNQWKSWPNLWEMGDSNCTHWQPLPSVEVSDAEPEPCEVTA